MLKSNLKKLSIVLGSVGFSLMFLGDSQNCFSIVPDRRNINKRTAVARTTNYRPAVDDVVILFYQNWDAIK